MTNDAEVTSEHHMAVLLILDALLKSSSLKFSDRLAAIRGVAQALANENAQGRKEGLEEAAKWLDKQAEIEDSVGIPKGIGMPWRALANAIRALQKPAEEKL